MNDNERQEFVKNDEGLYDWWQHERKGIARFVAEHRNDIDDVIENITGQHINRVIREGCGRSLRFAGLDRA